MTDRADLERIAGAAASGDARALDELLRSIDHQGLARPAVGRVLIDDAEIEEAMQETLIAVATSITRFDGKSAFTTWLWSVARNCAIGVLRRRPTAVPTDADHDISESRRISSMVAQRTSIEEVLTLLPEKFAAAVYLRDVEGLTYEMVAERLGLSIANTKSRIARGRAIAATSLRDVR